MYTKAHKVPKGVLKIHLLLLPEGLKLEKVLHGTTAQAYLSCSGSLFRDKFALLLHLLQLLLQPLHSFFGQIPH